MTATPAPTPATAAPALHVHREGTGEPLVLLHGMGESHVGWRPVITALADHCDVIAIDLPGFGRSPALPPSVPPTAANLGVAVEKALDNMGIGSYHVAGYSLGARVALHLAVGDRVTSVIAIGPDGLGTPLERVCCYLGLATGRGVAIALAPIAELLSWTPAGRSVFFAGNRTLPWQLTQGDSKQLLTDFAGSPAYEVANWVGMFDIPSRLHEITRPALFLQGTADPLAGQVMRYLPLIAHAQLRLLPGLNHVPISDDPTAITQHILTFLGDVPSVAPAPTKQS